LSSGEPPNSSMLNGLEVVDDGIGLQHADLEVVERGVVVDVLRALDEAVVGDDLDALVGRLLQHVGQRGAVDRRDHQHLVALGDHVLDLRELVRDVVVGVLQVGLVALGLQHLDHVVAVGDPACGRLGRHRDPDRALVLRLRACHGDHAEGHGGQHCLEEFHVLSPIFGRHRLGFSIRSSRPSPCRLNPRYTSVRQGRQAAFDGRDGTNGWDNFLIDFWHIAIYIQISISRTIRVHPETCPPPTPIGSFAPG
jgi:hypothetical protein